MRDGPHHDRRRHQFKTEGKVLAEPGWLEVAGKGRTQREALTPVKPGEPAAVKDVVVSAMQTKAPARYTEATLLSAMETAGKKLRTTSCAAPWPTRAWAHLPPAPRSSRA